MIKKIRLVLALGVVFWAGSWALFRADFFRVHDYVHGARIVEMTHALQDGHFPVRWSQNFGYGYGMPLFEFYAPLPYYVGSFFYWLGFDLITSIKLLFIICNLGTIIGGYLLGKKMFGQWGGMLVATAFTLAPYRAVNLFVRGALSEAWGMMAMPWILWGILMIIEDKKKWISPGWIVLTLGLIVLMLSHNLMTLMFVPVSVIFGAGYLLLVTRPTKWQSIWRLVWHLASGYLLAIGMTAFYTWPALAEKGLTKIDSILTGYFDYSNLEAIKMLIKLMGQSEDMIEYVKDRPGHDRRYAVDWSKAHDQLNWSPTVSLEEGLQKTIEWYKTHPDWWQPLKKQSQGFFDQNYQSAV